MDVAKRTGAHVERGSWAHLLVGTPRWSLQLGSVRAHPPEGRPSTAEHPVDDLSVTGRSRLLWGSPAVALDSRMKRRGLSPRGAGRVPAFFVVKFVVTLL